MNHFNLTPPHKPLELAQVASLLNTTPRILQAMVSGLDRDILQWHPTPEDWCINGIIGHLIEADRRAFAGRIQAIISTHNPQILHWNPVATSVARNDCLQNTSHLIDNLQVQRRKFANLVGGLTPCQLACTGTYRNYGTFTAADFVYEWAYHDFMHLKQISNNIQAFIWPNFSSTMQDALKS